MSRKMSPEDLLKAVRNHWVIENKLLYFDCDIVFSTSGCARTSFETGGTAGQKSSRRPDDWS